MRIEQAFIQLTFVIFKHSTASMPRKLRRRYRVGVDQNDLVALRPAPPSSTISVCLPLVMPCEYSYRTWWEAGMAGPEAHLSALHAWVPE